MKGFSSKHIAVEADVIGAKNILFAGASVHLSFSLFFLFLFTGWGSEGVKHSMRLSFGCFCTKDIIIIIIHAFLMR